MYLYIYTHKYVHTDLQHGWELPVYVKLSLNPKFKLNQFILL